MSDLWCGICVVTLARNGLKKWHLTTYYVMLNNNFYFIVRANNFLENTRCNLIPIISILFYDSSFQSSVE